MRDGSKRNGASQINESADSAGSISYADEYTAIGGRRDPSAGDDPRGAILRYRKASHCRRIACAEQATRAAYRRM
jgi:hypothetical protein